MKIYTIKDIAQLAGVSVTTVSRVLNHRPDVSRQTREKVERVMAEHHFVGNANARSLKQTDSDTVAIILRGRENPFLNALVEAMLHCGKQWTTSFLVEYIDEQEDEFLTALRLFNEKHVKGFLFVGSGIDERAQTLAQSEFPMVFATVSAEHSPLRQAGSVCIDDRAMARQAVQLLLDKGHQHIAIFGSSRNRGDSLSLRCAGALDAFKEAGLVFDPERFVETRFSLRGAYDTAKAFFSRKKDTTAVLCLSDTVAMGVIRALGDMNLRVPDDVSVIGFDGIDMGDYFLPRLSTVKQPVGQIAMESVHLLMEMLEHQAPPRHITVEATLRIRESLK